MSQLPFDLSLLKLSLIGLATWLGLRFFNILRIRFKTTTLPGPPRHSLLFGVSRSLAGHGDSSLRYEKWAEEYGNVYQIPHVAGSIKTILCDPKAIAHFYSLETWTYVQPALSKKFLENLFGRGLLWADGESHKRQRRALSPAFTSAAIRSYTTVFYDSAYKLKTSWDAILENSSSGNSIIDVQNWMNHVSLDSVGIAGFSHDFGSLHGSHSDVAEIFDAFGTLPTSALNIIIFLLGSVFPFLSWIPTERKKLTDRLKVSMHQISEILLDRSRKEKLAGTVGGTERSIIGQLIKTENADTGLKVTESEALAQMNVLILAGYETTSISLTWALIELSLHPEIQNKLRAELAEFSGVDPTYDQLTNGLPYLDAFTREILRLHPALPETNRVAVNDDIIPLSKPMVGPNGKKIDHIAIAKGSTVLVPIRCMNRSESIWGPDAKEIKPERWLTDDGKLVSDGGLTDKAKEIQGYHHLLTFVDGPRTCLGRHFALAEFKSVLSVLIRNYKFELRDGPENTKFGQHRTILPRPKVEGEDGAKVPLKVSRVD